MTENGKKWQVIYDLIQTMKNLTREKSAALPASQDSAVPGEYTFSCLRNPTDGIWTAELTRKQGKEPRELIGRAVSEANPKPEEVANTMAKAAPTLYTHALPLTPDIERLGDHVKGVNPHE